MNPENPLSPDDKHDPAAAPANPGVAGDDKPVRQESEAFAEHGAETMADEQAEESDDASEDEKDEDMDEDSEDEQEDEEDEEVDEGDPNELVTVESYRYTYEAELAKLHLEAEGITTFIIDAEAITMDWFLGNALGYIKLQVARAQAQAAVEILEKSRPDPMAVPPDDESEESTCLSCGCTMTEEQAACPSCGWSYESEHDARIMGQDTGITEKKDPRITEE